MDDDFFMYWVRNRLLTPTFESRYPDMKMILILDNAPYHHSLVPNGFRPDNMSTVGQAIPPHVMNAIYV